MSKQLNWTHTIDQYGQLQVAIIHPPVATIPTEMILLCHGFGAPGDDLVGLAESMIQQLQKHDRHPILVFPEAPIDMEEYGMPGSRAWWPINMARLMELVGKNDLSEMRPEVPPGLDTARLMLVKTVETLLERFSIQPASLTLGGFSQGAMLAVDTTLRGLQTPPGGLVAMSGALICEQLWRANADRLKNLRIIQSHGRYDTILPIQTGRWLNSLFRENCEKISYHEFDGPHTIPMEAIELICRK